MTCFLLENSAVKHYRDHDCVCVPLLAWERTSDVETRTTCISHNPLWTPPGTQNLKRAPIDMNSFRSTKLRQSEKCQTRAILPASQVKLQEVSLFPVLQQTPTNKFYKSTLEHLLCDLCWTFNLSLILWKLHSRRTDVGCCRAVLQLKGGGAGSTGGFTPSKLPMCNSSTVQLILGPKRVRSNQTKIALRASEEATLEQTKERSGSHLWVKVTTGQHNCEDSPLPRHRGPKQHGEDGTTNQ